MSGIYEAIAETSDGTYKAVQFGEGVICILEEGVEGVVDFVPQPVTETTSPESLLPALVGWIYEMRRGLEIKSAGLTRRDF